MPVELVTVPDVEIVSTGTYSLASGETTFSAEDLADAVRAAADPTVSAPRIKLGHDDPRFAELDGEPAFGTVQNLRLTPDGQTIIGDYVDVPSWLAETLQSSYPGRSIEGGFQFTAASGRSYRLVIANVALLGVTWPGVSSLADLREILERNGHPATATDDEGQVAVVGGHAQRFATASPQGRDPSAGLDLGSISRQFCADLDEGEVPTPAPSGEGPGEFGSQAYWWPRSIRVEDDGSLTIIADDDSGHLIRVPFTVAGNELSYGTPQVVVESYVPVSASMPRILAAWSDRAASRPSTTTEGMMDIDPAVLRTRLGLPEDADEAAITAALETPEPEPGPTAPEPEPPPAPAIPEGMALVDQATLEEIRNGAQQGAAVAARMAVRDRDETIAAALGEGRFPVSRREHYESMWDRDPEGTRTLLTAAVDQGGLATGLVPVRNQETGRAGDGEGNPTVEAEHEAFMARYNPQTVERLRGDHRGRVRVRTEA